MKIAVFCVTFGVLGAAHAEETLRLSVMGPEEVLAGDPESTSVDTRGVIGAGLVISSLGPELSGPVTALVRLPRDEIVFGTATGQVFSIDASRKSVLLDDTSKLVVSALAAHRSGTLVATNPDGAITFVDEKGKTSPYFDPTEKYIWAVLPANNRVYVATGEPGRILEIVDGKPPRVVFEPGETHVRALLWHPERGLIAGGGQKGIVYQVAPSGEAFALHDSAMDEVTALSLDPKTNDLYGAWVTENEPPPPTPPAEKSIGMVAGETSDAPSPVKGSEVARIAMSGRVDVVWTSRNEGAMALAFDADRRSLVVATGAGAKSRARLYAIDIQDRDRLRLVARLSAPTANAVIRNFDGGWIVGTGPLGAIVQVGPKPRPESVYTSKEQDLERTGRIGRIWYDATLLPNTEVEIRMRAGNTKEADATWSKWCAPVRNEKGGDIVLPEARYVQFQATLRGSKDGASSPQLRALFASVLRKNLAPNVLEVFPLAPGVYMRPMPDEEEHETTVSLSASQIDRLRHTSRDERVTRVRQGVLPGMLTVAWRAEDPNRDELEFRAEIRPLDHQGPFVRLGDEIEQSFFSFDTRAYADGRYQVRVTASDRRSNTPADSLEDTHVSDPILIDRTPPTIESFSVSATKDGVRILARAKDATSLVAKAEVSVDGGPWVLLPAQHGVSYSPELVISVEVRDRDLHPRSAFERKKATYSLRVEDEADNVAFAEAKMTP